MTETIIINQVKVNNRSNNLDSIREEIKMSLVNMGLNIGTFKINLSINRNIEMLNKKTIRVQESNRINKAILNKNDVLLHGGMYNFY